MFAHSMKSPLLAVASLSLALILTPIRSIAQPTSLEEYSKSDNGWQSGITSLSTAHGILQVGSEACGTRPPLDECQVITLNGKNLFSDTHASILAVYRSLTNPLLVAIGTDSGGNCACTDKEYIIDFTSSRPIIIQNSQFGKDITASEKGVIFSQYVGTDELGDTSLGLFRYQLGTGHPQLLRKFSVYSQTPLLQKTHPNEILSDPIVRAPLLQAVGKSNFAEFRSSMGVSEAPKIIDNRFIVASGCMQHACTFKRGMFIIDQTRHVAWALEWSKSETSTNTDHLTLWGVLRKKTDAVAVREIEAWLHANGLNWYMITVAPLPPNVSQAYASPEIPEPAPKTNEIPERAPKTTNRNLPERASKTNNVDPLGKTVLTAAHPANSKTELSPIALFKMLAPSIFIVHAKRSNGDEFQGSAVAISAHTLLTNCHLVDGAAEIGLTQKGRQLDVTLISADVEADRCVLQTSSEITSYVTIRPYDELEIGEKLYSIGAPSA
jgi:Trypsin-like peptidase domain